jgi:RimJ/RimL family protein N-acetyltransferase
MLETKRLRLRRFVEADLDHLFALDNDPAVMRFINGGIATPRSFIEKHTLPMVMHFDKDLPEFGFWAVIRKEDQAFLGWLSFRLLDKTSREVSLGYRFHKAAWRQGYATEGARALIDKGFSELGVKCVRATTFEHNLASRRVMEKLGMKLVRRFRLSQEEIKQTDTSYSESAELWDGDDLEYALEPQKVS